MSFALLAPEINSGLIYSGPGSTALLAAATAWDGLAADLYTTATSYQSVITNLISDPWQGTSSTAMATATAPFIAWLNTTASQAAQTGTQAKIAASAFETARATSIPPPVITANRALLATLIATNLLGQNTPAIAATEMHYLEMWIQDGIAMDTYAATSQQATTLPQHTTPPPVANPALTPTTAAVQAATTTSTTTTALSDLSTLLSDLGITMPSLTLPTSLADIPTWLTTTLSSLSGLGGTGASSSAALLPLQAGYYGAMLASMPARMFTSMGTTMPNTTGLLTGSQTLLNSVGQLVDGKMQAVLGGVSNQLRTWGTTVSAQLASAHRLGGLSIPQTWSTTTPTTLSRATPTLPNTTITTPTMSATLPNNPFTQALMGALTGRGLNNLTTKTPKITPHTPTTTP
jgi:PPE-repeat protein